MDGRFVEAALLLISDFGYPPLFAGLALEFIGVPFPGEIFLTFTGFLVWAGHFRLIPALLVTAAGSLAGTAISYFLGRKFGRPFLRKYGKYFFIHQKQIDRAEREFNRHRYIVLLLGRFVPGIRPLSAYVAGVAGMKFFVFLPLSIAGSVIWCLTFLLIGNQLGAHWQEISELLPKYYLVLSLIAAAGLPYLIWKAAKFKKRIF